ncbi:hypothetical protein J7S27_00675 [Carnobacteriaceae bacterium zg-C25]|nr:hypothetical protein J7S27_00675 [Carnobacteriaceae bacterium zg-C25]
MKKETGLVSVMMMYVLLPLLLLAMVCVDGSRVIFAKQTVGIANDVTLENILAHYNADLKRIYGLYATKMTPQMEEELLTHYLQSVRGSLSNTQIQTLANGYIQNGVIDKALWDAQTRRKSSSSMTNLNGIRVLQKPEIQPVSNSTLYNADILKYQIVEYMKYRGPMSMAENLLEKIGVLKGQDKPTKSREKQLQEDKEQVDTLKKLYALQPRLQKLNEYITNLAFFDVESANELVTKLDGKENAKELVQQARLQMSRYQTELEKASEAIQKIKVEHMLVTELRNSIKHEIDAVKSHQTLLEQLDVVERPDVTHINQTNGQQKVTTHVSVKKEVAITKRNLSKNVAFLQLVRHVKEDTSSVSLIQSVKQVYQSATTPLQTQNMKTPNGQSGAINNNVQEVLPNQNNVFTDALNRIQGVTSFFTQANSVGDTFANVINELLVCEYITEMFTNYLDRQGAHTPLTKQTLLNGVPLNAVGSLTRGVEVEYLLFGKDTPQDNVQEALRRIKLIRFVFNLAYTYTSAELRALLFSSSLIAGPFAKGLEVFLHVLVALAETQMDEYLLLKGQRVALVKTPTTFKMQPSQVANGLLSFASDTITQQLNRTVDTVEENVLDWFEGGVDEVEKKVVKRVDDWITQQENAILNTLSQQIERPLQDLVTAQLTTLNQADNALKEKIDEGFASLETRLIQSVEKHETLGAIHNLVILLKENMHDLRASYVQLVEKSIKNGNQSIGNALQNVIREYLNRVTQPIRAFVQDKANGYKENVLSIVRQQTHRVGDGAKEKLKGITQRFLGETSKPFQTNSFQTTNVALGLTYTEYLKIFVLFELISNPQSPLYKRMVDLIGQNTKLNLTQFHTVFEMTSTYQVDTFVIEAFKHNYHTTTILGY